MRLGATIGRYVNPADYEAYVAELVRQGYRAADCPRVSLAEPDKISAVKRLFAKHDIVISEVGAWVNPLHPRPEESAKNIKIIEDALALADEVGALCCVACAGSFDETLFYQAHPLNFSTQCFDATVEWVRKVLRDVKPRRAKLGLEMAPWTLLDGPQMYLKLVQAVNHPGLAVHLDPANAVRDAHMYYSTTELLNDCFDTLGKWIIACHAKDIQRATDPHTVAFVEVAPGKGALDYRTFLTRADKVSPDLPLLIEHLTKEEEFTSAANYIRSVAREVGVTV
jgi:sugar phosphate isomerase/epimerase